MKQTGAALALGIIGAAMLLLVLGWFDPGAAELRATRAALATEQAVALAPLQLSVKRALLASLGVAGVSVALLALATAIVGVGSVPAGLRAARIRSWLIHPGRHGALYPALAEPDGQGHIRIVGPVNETGSQRVAALTTGLGPDVRLQGSAVRQVLRGDDPQAMLPAPEAPANIGLEQVLAFDPQTSPHWLCVGDTGSGKSTAIYAIANQLHRQLGAQFVILEREAQDWNDQAAAVTVPGYLAALECIEEERQRRAALLREADVDHISKLASPPDYLCVILEEAESVYQAMRLIGAAQGTRYKAIVRDIASMGRKQGILLVVATQTGTSEVFDVPTRKNLGHKLFFRNEPAVGDSWGIPREVGISRLPTGTAYSLNHSALVAFPRQPRPRLPISSLYRETIGTVLEPQNGRVYAAEATPFAVPVPVLRISDRRKPTPEEAAAMRAHYRRTGSHTAVCVAFYGYKNGDVWDWVGCALRGEL